MLRGGQFSVIITPFSWSILGYQNQPSWECRGCIVLDDDEYFNMLDKKV